MKFFEDYNKAEDYLKMKKQVNRDKNTLYILTDGPENNFAVMTLKQFFDAGLKDSGLSYRF